VLVVFTNPLYPEYELQNKSEQPIGFAQISDGECLSGKGLKNLLNKNQSIDDKIVGNKFLYINPKGQIPYAWQDRVQPVKKLMIKIEGVTEVINMEKAQKLKIIETENGSRYQVDVRVSGNAKKLRISNIKNEEEGKGDFESKAAYLQ